MGIAIKQIIWKCQDTALLLFRDSFRHIDYIYYHRSYGKIQNPVTPSPSRGEGRVRGTTGIGSPKKVYEFVDKIQNFLYNMNHSIGIHGDGSSISSLLLPALMES